MPPERNSLVSVIIPCYNVADYIAECIGSVKAQTFRNTEIICIDNGSSDDTRAKLRELSENTPRLIFDVENKKGANAARNKGMSIARGEWLQFLDADDLLMPGKIAHQMALATGTEPAYIAGAYLKRDRRGNDQKCPGLFDDPYAGPFCNRHGITSSNLWNKEALKRVGGFNEELMSSQETDLMLRLVLDGGRAVADHEANTVIRERHGGQISTSEPVKRWTQYVSVRVHYLEKLKSAYPEIYLRSRQQLLDFLVVSLLTLARYDRKRAGEFYRRCVKGEWTPGNNFGITPVKGLLVRAMGLSRYASIFRN